MGKENCCLILFCLKLHVLREHCHYFVLRSMDSWDIAENTVIILSQGPWTHGILLREHSHYFVSRSMDSWDIAERTQSLFCLKIHGLMGYC